MKSHVEFTDEEFEQRFQNCLIEPEIFSHEAHLRLAWIHIKKYGSGIAIDNICNQLKRYVEFLGVTEKYNETVTVAAIKAVHHFILKTPANSFTEYISENPRLKDNFKELLCHHYLTDIFNSQEVKKKYLEPELLPFD
jgi:hypothetical protein